MRLAPTTLAVLALAAALPLPASAQGSASATIRAAYLEDLATLESKFTSLAEAFGEETFDWAPMEGVRSVRQVVGLITAENTLFPSRFLETALPDSWTARDPQALMAGTGMSRTEMLAALKASFAVARELWAAQDDAAMAAEHNFFGRQMTGNAIAVTWLADQHEHLGQLIAYARMNRIVPPWSRTGG